MTTSINFLACCFSYLLSFVVSQYGTESVDGALIENRCLESGYCYDIWQFSTPVTKQQAQQKCIEEKQTLATIGSRDDEIELERLLTTDAWIGLSMTARDQFYWLGETMWYENPIPGGDIITAGNFGTGCLLLNRDELRDGSCNYVLPYICEFHDESTANLGCDGPASQLNTRWVCMKGEELSGVEGLRWVQAARNCIKYKGNLLILRVGELEKVQEMLVDKSGHYWTAGTRIITKWDEGNIMVNPYSLIWAEEISANPNVEEALIKDVCAYLSEEQKGLIHKLCEDTLSLAVCSRLDERFITTTEVTNIGSRGTLGDQNEAYNLISTTNGNTLLHSTTTASSPVYMVKVANYTGSESVESNISDVSGTIEYSEGQDMVVSKRRYKTVLIFAYIMAALLFIAIALFIALFIWSSGGWSEMLYQYGRQRKRKTEMYDLTYNRKTSYKTLGDGTLGRQRSTDPIEEWDKVLIENGDSQMVEKLSNDDMDIVHSHVEEPLTIPREPEFVTLQRGKSVESHSSLANSDVATFTIDRASSRSSILKPPPVPPKIPCNTAGRGMGLPPPPPDLVPDITQSPHQYSPPAHNHDDLADIEPPLLPKPAKRPPRKQKKKLPDVPIYSQLEKFRKLPPPPTSPKPDIPIHTQGLLHTLPPPPPPLNIDTTAPTDSFSDSGVDMGVNSPHYSF
ncbi:uncharacterized protein [Watersipora subatra]|uniref:uncharacterized protein isoform X2 n=1 Tax=Watersipora subatra TaxID=2589382 RepID=UPI00355BDD57